MSRPWHLADPALFATEKSSVEAAYPNLNFHVNGDVVVRGTLPVIFEGETLDRYLVDIELPRDYPTGVPVVREVGERIPQDADHHMSADGTACVLLPDERWRVWPKGSTLLQFLEGPVRNFFLGQSLFELGDAWPFGQWGHGADGIREYYSDLLATEVARVIVRYLDLLASKKIKGHRVCPCGSGKRLRDCHRSIIDDLSPKIPPEIALESSRKIRSKLLTARSAS